MTKNKQRITLFTIAGIWVLMGLLLFVATDAYAQTATTRNNSDIYSQISLFSEVLVKLKDAYVTDLSDEELIKAAIVGMLGSTDPHTNYFTPDEFTDFTTSTKGSFGGLGIQIDKKGDYITVVSPIEGTPAFRMGISAGDRILKVDGASVVGSSTDEAIRRMRGDVGTEVRITIGRPGVADPLEFTIIREVIQIKSIPYFFKLDNGVGYIRISQFNENTASELRTALGTLESQNIRGLIIDLRWNPGGLLDQAVDTVNEFIGAGKLVVETRGRRENRPLYTRYNTPQRNYPIIALVNEASASASEIFAGSLQDWDKGLVMGKTTFGKGSVQQLLRLGNGGGIKVTTSYYYIKSGRCIHKMSNDKLLKGQELTEAEIAEENERNHEHVYQTVNGRTVYGGGGINPDWVVDADLLTNLGVELRRNNVFFDFAVDYLVDHGHDIPLNFQVSNALYNEFLGYARSKNISFSPADADSAATFIRNSIRSELIGKVHGDLEAYKVSISGDVQLQAAIDFFNRFRTLQEMFDYAARNQAPPTVGE
ncbi:MAG: phage tail protein [Candidatus Cloacimonetes bacterium HGW-Cloacimonetes-2]|jgi:carboxyl-terminal processing protease|nr:MAG: phage tail protein [Candidatus Cloacimonetes bacterium HGW-Cloacimonetes-2]